MPEANQIGDKATRAPVYVNNLMAIEKVIKQKFILHSISTPPMLLETAE